MTWKNVDDIRGPKGDQGPKGDRGADGVNGAAGAAAAITAVTAVPLPEGSAPSSSVSGPNTARQIILGIPAGARGARGPAGTIGSVTAESVPAGQVAQVIMTGNDEVKHAHFKVPRGLPGLNAVGNDEAFAAALGAPDSETGAVFQGELASKADRRNVLVSIRDFGGTGDGVTSDALAATQAAAASKAVLYPAGQYAGAGAFGNAYSATNYKDAIAERTMSGLPGAPVDDPLPVLWVQKHSSSNRATNSQQWDNGAIYAALVKESGDAYGAALTGYARHDSADSGDLIGVHGRGLATKTASKVWGGWFYAASVDAAAVTNARGLAGAEINVSHRGADTGWSATTTENQQHGLLVMAADGAKVATRAIAVGRVSSPDGSFHTGLMINGTAITPVDAGTDFTTTIGNNEAILITGASARSNGIRFHTGLHGVGVSFAEGSFRSNMAMLFGSRQRIGVGNGPSTPAVVELVNDDSNTRFVNLLNMKLQVNGTQVVGVQRTGWAEDATGPISRATFQTDTVTLPQLAARFAALLQDLRAHGLINPAA